MVQDMSFMDDFMLNQMIYGLIGFLIYDIVLPF